jgi:hypothetical protein
LPGTFSLPDSFTLDRSNKEEDEMKKLLSSALFVILLSGLTLTVPADAQTSERWLHVRVEQAATEDQAAETVRVNLPLRVAEKILPAIHADKLQEGRIRLRHGHMHGVDLRAVLEAIQELGDGEFLTVQSDDANVRVAKQGGYLLVSVDEQTGDAEKVDVKLPFTVVEALLSGEKDELNVLAAIQALSEHQDDALVTVQSEREMVRVWIDSKSTME